MWRHALGHCKVFRHAVLPVCTGHSVFVLHDWRRFGLIALELRLSVRHLTIPAHRFADILSVQTQTNSCFAGLPLASICGSVRGNILADVARMVVTEMDSGAKTSDAISGTCCDGRLRGKNASEYDWLWDSRRVECKSSQLQWNTSRQHWFFHFGGVKLPFEGSRSSAAFDELIMILYTPEQLFFYKHDLLHRVSSQGLRTSPVGHCIMLNGPRRETNWRIALEVILADLDADTNGCMFMSSLSLEDDMVTSALATRGVDAETSLAYNNVPLSQLSPKARGDRIEELVRAVDATIHLDAHIEEPVVDFGVDGRRRCKSSAGYDWRRNGRRIECKSGQLRWCRVHRVWKVYFSGIKMALEGVRPSPAFDELQLALYSPSGVHILEHNLRFHVSTAGNTTSFAGHCVVVSAETGDTDYSRCLDVIRQKFLVGGCKEIAFVTWS
eukprot:TRINITY_DN13360_c0_g1_i10.p1 TRINITY_DN13360_c0_g1~~TRINITY_DN13360_c0_g1_i10.p1  ORF type:complete len:441 (+),score=37.66 TRINITY_DN13360_c0_g1_i10:85-1407(+)